MRLLVGLGLLQAVLRIGVVGAAILPVVVEEELVQLVLEVIMMGDVALRPGGAVAAEQPLPAQLALLDRLAVVAAFLPPVVGGDQLEQVEDRPVLDDQPAVHIGFADRQARVAHQLEDHPPVGDANGQLLTAAGTIGFAASVRLDQCDPAASQQRPDQPGNQRHEPPSMSATGWPVTRRCSRIYCSRVSALSGSFAFLSLEPDQVSVAWQHPLRAVQRNARKAHPESKQRARLSTSSRAARCPAMRVRATP